MPIRHFRILLIGLAITPLNVSAQQVDEPTVYAKRSAIVVAEPGIASSTGKFPSFKSSREIPAATLRSVEVPSSAIAIPAVTVCSSLAVVLGLFAAMVWLTRKYGSRSSTGGTIPSEVLQSLGSTAIDARTRLTMVRCGNRILVLGQTATELRSLTEITDPEEVRYLTASCLGNAKRNFRETIASIEKEPHPPGFSGTRDADSFATPRSRGKLFATA